MKKTLGLTIVLLIIATLPCAASPLADYSLGNIAFDINLSSPNLSTNNLTADSKLRIGYDLTVGLGFGFAWQFTSDDFKTTTALHGDKEFKIQQLNLINNVVGIAGVNISWFAGISQIELVGNSHQNGVAAGLIGSTPITPSTKGYAILTAGNHVAGYELGIGYTVAKNTEINLAYHEKKYKGLTFSNGGKDNVTRKGLSTGVTYKF